MAKKYRSLLHVLTAGILTLGCAQAAHLNRAIFF